jgi:hypothetical protein
MPAKPALPLDQAFDVADLFALLRPRLKRHATFQEACAECAASLTKCPICRHAGPVLRVYRA